MGQAATHEIEAKNIASVTYSRLASAAKKSLETLRKVRRSEIAFFAIAEERSTASAVN